MTTTSHFHWIFSASVLLHFYPVWRNYLELFSWVLFRKLIICCPSKMFLSLCLVYKKIVFSYCLILRGSQLLACSPLVKMQLLLSLHLNSLLDYKKACHLMTSAHLFCTEGLCKKISENQSLLSPWCVPVGCIFIILKSCAVLSGLCYMLNKSSFKPCLLVFYLWWILGLVSFLEFPWKPLKS